CLYRHAKWWLSRLPICLARSPHRVRYGATFSREAAMARKALIIKDTHRGLLYEDGVLKRTLEAGRFEFPKPPLFGRTPETEIVLVDVRERELTIKGQEILTSDKGALRVSIIVQ